MDWLGFSSLKGQLTNLTKDLLLEDSNEIEDPVAQLRIANSRICELENFVDVHKSEINSLRTENEEIRIQLESSLLRLDHAKEDFKIQLSEKDAIILKLRSKSSSERGEPEGESEALFNLYADINTKNTPNSSSKSYGDLISELNPVLNEKLSTDGTATWEELRNEVVQLRIDLTKWKRIAKKKQSKQGDETLLGISTYELEKEIEQLKQQLIESKELRHTELSAIQENYTDHLSILMGQMKETESELISLRKQMDDMCWENSSKALVHDMSSLLVDNDSQPMTSTISTTTNTTPIISAISSGSSDTTNDTITNSQSSSPVCARPTNFKNVKKKKKQNKNRYVLTSSTNMLDKETLNAITKTGEQYHHDFSSQTISCTGEDKLISCEVEVCENCSQTLSCQVDTISTQFSNVRLSIAHRLSSDALRECASQTSLHELTDTESQTDFNGAMKDAVTEYDMTQSSSISVQTESSSHSSCMEIQLDLAEPCKSEPFELSPIQNPHSDSCASSSSSSSSFSSLDLANNPDKLDRIVQQFGRDVEMYERDFHYMVHLVFDNMDVIVGKFRNLGISCDQTSLEKLVKNMDQFRHKLLVKRDKICNLYSKEKVQLSSDFHGHQNQEKSADSNNVTDDEPKTVLSDKPESPDDGLDLVKVDQVNNWQFDDFSELNSNDSNESKDSRLIGTGEASDLADKQVITQPEINTNETDKTSTVSTHCVAELENRSSTMTVDLEHALQMAVSHLTRLPSVPDELVEQNANMGQPWPPTCVEDYLALLTCSELVSRTKVDQFQKDLSQLKDLYDQLEVEKQFLNDQIGHYQEQEQQQHSPEREQTYLVDSCTELVQHDDEEVVDECIGGKDVIYDLAYQLCAQLDPDKTQSEWNVLNWECVLLEALKNRLDSNTESITEYPDDCTNELSAEVAALKDILNQHDQFRSQAECDLKHLLSTIHEQQELIETLTTDKQQLERQIVQTEKSLVDVVDDHHDDDDENRLNNSEFYIQIFKQLESMGVDHLEHSSNSVSHQSIHDQHLGCLGALQLLDVHFSKLKTKLTENESICANLWTSLQQKHAESHNYHQQLQKVLNDCNELHKSKEECQFLIQSLREQLDLKEQEVTESSMDRTQTQPDSSLVLTESTVDPNTNEYQLTDELKRLQAHLIEIEESYTIEALQAENREVELRSQLSKLGSKVRHFDEANDTIADRIQIVQTERDDALDLVRTYQKEIKFVKENLVNLQSVLDHFQRGMSTKDQSVAIQNETDRIRLDLNRSNQELSNAQLEIHRLTQYIENAVQSDKQRNDLQIQNERLNDQLVRLQSKIKQREVEIEQIRSRLAKMALDTDSRIDKTLVKNLLISYFQLPSNQRNSGLRVIGSLLEFTDDDYSKVGKELRAMPKLMEWVKNVVAIIPSGPPKDIVLSPDDPNKSFSELLLAFLEKESSPRSPIKLPIDYYTPESVRPSSSLKRNQIDGGLSEVMSPDFKQTSHSELTNPPNTTSLSYVSDSAQL